MAWTYEQLITEMHSRHNDAQTELAWGRTDYNSAQFKWGIPDDHGAIDSLMDAWYHNNQAIEDALASSFYGYNGATNIIPTALDLLEPVEAPEPYVLTMRKILDEMFTASNPELLQFIALIDAYRQSLWTKPFDINYWAAVARGFEQWE